MAAESAAYALAAVSQAPEPFRRMLSDIFGRRPGICTAASWAVSQSGTPAMNVSVAAGTGLVPGQESSTQGLYFCQSIDPTVVAINAADATNPRRDLVVARIRDNQYATGPTSAFSIEAIAGTPAASPVDPIVPVNCLVLARVQVNASPDATIVTGDITDLRTSAAGQQRAAALGGMTVCTSTTRPTVNLHEGLLAYEADTDRAVVYNGSAWIGLAATTMPPPQFFTGSVSGGTQTGTFAAITTQNSVLVAPYPLTMVVEVFGDVGANTAANTVHLEISDEAGTSIVTGTILSGGVFSIANKAGSENKSYAIMGKKDYTAGQTCGFRFRYRVDTSNIFIGSHAKVTFYPKVS